MLWENNLGLFRNKGTLLENKRSLFASEKKFFRFHPHTLTSSLSNADVQGVWTTLPFFILPHVSLTFWVTYYILSLRIAKCDPPEAKTLGRREGESFVPNVPKTPYTSWFDAKTLGCEGKIAIPISPKVIFVTFGEI